MVFWRAPSRPFRRPRVHGTEKFEHDGFLNEKFEHDGFLSVLDFVVDRGTEKPKQQTRADEEKHKEAEEEQYKEADNLVSSAGAR